MRHGTPKIQEAVTNGLKENLMRLRYLKGWGLEEMESASQITKSRITTLERGKECASPTTLKRLAEALGCTIGDICPALLQPVEADEEKT